MALSETLEQRLAPYQNEILLAQSIILWQRPIPFAGILLSLDILLVWSWYIDLGVIGFVFLLCFAVYAVALLLIRFGFHRSFAAADPLGRDLYSFDQICAFLDFLLGRAGQVADFLIGRPFAEGAVRIGLVAVIWVTIAFVLNMIGSFWLFTLALNLVLCAPGVIQTLTAQQKPHED
jgi:hypothetical protein